MGRTSEPESSLTFLKFSEFKARLTRGLVAFPMVTEDQLNKSKIDWRRCLPSAAEAVSNEGGEVGAAKATPSGGGSLLLILLHIF